AQNGANRVEKNKKWNPADHRVQLGESLKRHEPPFVPIRKTLKEGDQKARKGGASESSISFTKQYCGSPSSSEISTNVAEQSSAAQFVKTINTIWRGFCGDLKKEVLLPQDGIANTKAPMCFRLAREGGCEPKTTRLMS
ncbi:hypothetical protein H5410_022002, partial [Solanum commersonii]